MRRALVASLVLGTLLTACDRSSPRGGGIACGLAAVAGPTALLNEFGVPHQTLGVAPDQLPSRLVVRLAAGPALPAVVGRTDSLWMIGVEGTPPPNSRPGFGVLVLDPSGKAQGVMAYEGPTVEGAPQIGTVAFDTTMVPLVGIQVDPGRFEDPACPFFPDSVLR